MLSRRHLLGLGFAAVSAQTQFLDLAFAQGTYPDRPIRLIVPFPPGGVYDSVGRPWADKVKSTLGTVIIENQGGAGGSLGTLAVARSQPDGYTLLMGGGGPIVVTPFAVARPAYDPVKDLDPVYVVVINGAGLAVHPSVPVQSLKELIDYTKANPGKMSYASAGVGSLTHLGGELFKSLTGIRDLVHIPYRGMGPALNDLVSGQIPLAMPIITGQVLSLHRAGKIRLLAVTTTARLASAPDIPTAVEAGVSGMIAQGFIGLFAPAKTPEVIINKVADATRTALDDRDYQQLLISSGLEPVINSGPTKAREFVRTEIERWNPVIKNIGLKLD